MLTINLLDADDCVFESVYRKHDLGGQNKNVFLPAFLKDMELAPRLPWTSVLDVPGAINIIVTGRSWLQMHEQATRKCWNDQFVNATLHGYVAVGWNDKLERSAAMAHYVEQKSARISAIVTMIRTGLERFSNVPLSINVYDDNADVLDRLADRRLHRWLVKDGCLTSVSP